MLDGGGWRAGNCRLAVVQIELLQKRNENPRRLKLLWRRYERDNYYYKLRQNWLVDDMTSVLHLYVTPNRPKSSSSLSPCLFQPLQPATARCRTAMFLISQLTTTTSLGLDHGHRSGQKIAVVGGRSNPLLQLSSTTCVLLLLESQCRTPILQEQFWPTMMTTTARGPINPSSCLPRHLRPRLPPPLLKMITPTTTPWEADAPPNPRSDGGDERIGGANMKINYELTGHSPDGIASTMMTMTLIAPIAERPYRRG